MRNILVNIEELEVYILDYGSACSYFERTNCGFTAFYASPEFLIRNTWTNIQTPEDFFAADIFSIGTILFELFSMVEFHNALD